MSAAAVRSIDYRIADIRFRVETAHDRLHERLTAWLADYALPDGDPEAPGLVLTLHGYGEEDPLPALPEGALYLFASEDIRYYDADGRWVVAYPDGGLMIVDRASGRLTGHARAERLLSSVRTFEIFIHPLYELFRHRGLYPFHAASVALDDRGVLLLGRSGRGKSTLTADLVASGFGFLSDDRCFIRESEDRYEMFAHYEPFKLFARNVSHIPPLGGSEEMAEASAKKRGLDIRRYYPDQARLASPLSCIVFPFWTPGEASRLEPMAPGRALIETLPLTLVCFDPDTGKTQFGFAGRLLRNVPAWRLVMGDDRHNWHKLVRESLGT